MSSLVEYNPLLALSLYYNNSNNVFKSVEIWLCILHSQLMTDVVQPAHPALVGRSNNHIDITRQRCERELYSIDSSAHFSNACSCCSGLQLSKLASVDMITVVK